jgi:hypothetical protein
MFTIDLVVLAQSGNVSGTVTEESRNLSLSGVSVHIEGQRIEAVTDASGRYLLQGVKAGSVKISASYLGLETAMEEITVLPGETVT